MRSFIGKSIAGLALASTVALTAAPADAQYYRRHHHHGDDAAWAVGAGILGLGVGAAIASSNRSRYYNNGYYGDRYYNNGYSGGYYDRGYYGDSYYRDPYYGNGYAYNRCTTRRVWDDYAGRWIRVRYC